VTSADGANGREIAACTMISTSIFGLARLAWTVARAGVFCLSTHASHTEFMSAKFRMSVMKICAERSFDLSLPTPFKIPSIFLRTCSVWPLMSADGSSATIPARYTVSPWTTAWLRRGPTPWRLIAIDRSPL